MINITILKNYLFPQSLVANLSEGTQRLSHATKAGEATLPSTSASGQTKIRQELQAMNKDFEDFRVQLVQVGHRHR